MKTLDDTLRRAAGDVHVAVGGVTPQRPVVSAAALAAGIAIVLALVGGIWLAGRFGGERQLVTPVGSGADVRSWGFETWTGEQAALQDYTGRPLVVNFWASWCPYCEEEMAAALEPLHRELDGGVVFVGLNLQDDRRPADALVARTGVTYPLGLDPLGDFYAEFGGLTMPFTVFLDSGGHVVRLAQGPLDRDDLAREIEKLYGISLP